MLSSKASVPKSSNTANKDSIGNTNSPALTCPLSAVQRIGTNNPIQKTANVVQVKALEDALRWVNVATQTVGVYPERLRLHMRDELALHGVQRVMPLGEMFTMATVDPEQTYGLPHDGMEPDRRSVRWVIDQSAQPQ